VVVYALSDPGFLTGLDGLPGDDPEALDGVAFPVLSTPEGGPLAATRFVLNPRMLGEPGPDRDRLIRHELTHVAIGERDDGAPVWLSEGLAEYVSVQPLDPADRHIAGAAIAAAESGVRDLPADDTFNDGSSEANYGLSWWACEYVARSYGASLLWTLLDLLDQPDSTEDEQDAVLQEMLGIGRHELARRAARLLVVTFDPGSLAPPEPVETPASPESSDG
jgi:hypothetical protein